MYPKLIHKVSNLRGIRD